MPRKLATHHFGRYGEFIVSFELLKRGWNTYTPIYDKRIDLIAHKIIKNDEFKFRTIQIRSSRLVNKHQNFGFKIFPKDLYDNENHFFIICLMGKRGGFKFLVMSVKDYKNIMGNALKTKSFQKGRYRHHINKNTYKEGKKDFSIFLNKFNKLE